MRLGFKEGLRRCGVCVESGSVSEVTWMGDMAAMATTVCSTACGYTQISWRWKGDVSAYDSGRACKFGSQLFGKLGVSPLRISRRNESCSSVGELEWGIKSLSIRAQGDEGSSQKVSVTGATYVKRAKVPVKPGNKQRVILRFLWLEKNIGIALDQAVPGHGTMPLSPYFFWPRKDAWEELKLKLDSKKWISRKRTIVLLNQTTDIINLWQQNAASQM